MHIWATALIFVIVFAKFQAEKTPWKCCVFYWIKISEWYSLYVQPEILDKAKQHPNYNQNHTFHL